MKSILMLMLIALAGCPDASQDRLLGGDAAITASTDAAAPDRSFAAGDMTALPRPDVDGPTDDDAGSDPNNAPTRCADDLTGSGVVEGPQGIMIQVPSVADICAMERALDHVCSRHDDDMHDLLLTSVETWEGGEVLATLDTEVLDAIAPYFRCFDNVFVGTMSEILLDDPYAPATINDPDERWRWIRAATEVARLIAPWMDANHGPGWHWYISYEANLNAFTDVTYRNGYVAMLQQHIMEVQAIHQGVVAWSPTFWTAPSTLGAAARAALSDALTNTFERVPIDWVLIQDHLGVQPSWTCADALAYYDLVGAAAPNLASLQMNVEYFTIDGNGIRAGDASDLAARIQCYRDAGASIGASFEYRYWYQTHGH